MGVISVKGPQFGQSYSVNIFGDTPTPEEQSRINQFVTDQELTMAQRIEERFGTPTEEIVEEEQLSGEVDRTAVGRGILSDRPSRQRSQGKTLEVIGEEYGLDWLKNTGTERKEQAEERLRQLEAEDPSVRFDDIKDVGTFGSFAGEALGGEAEDIAIQTAATVGGAAFFGPVGAAVARAGATAFTTARALPEMFAEAVEKQEEAGMELSIPKAAAATAANAVSEFIVDYFIIGKFLTPTDGKLAKRILMEGGKAGGLEGLQEAQQVAVNRFQAGLDLFDEDAKREYAEAFVSGAVVGGPLGGTAGAFGRDPQAGVKRKEANDELDQDINEDTQVGTERLKFALEGQKQDAEEAERIDQVAEFDRQERERVATEGLGVPTQEALPVFRPAALLPSPSSLENLPETTPSDFKNKSFTKPVYDEVVRQVKSDVTPSQEDVDAGLLAPKINVNKIVEKVRQSIPDTNKKQITDVLTEMQSQGLVTENTDYTAKKTSKYTPSDALVGDANTPDVSLRREIDSSAAKVKLLQEGEKKTAKGGLRRLQYDLISAQRNGVDLDGNETTENAVLSEIASVEQRIAKEQDKIEVAQSRLKNIGQEMHVPRIERVGTPATARAIPVGKATPQQLKPRENAQKATIEEETRQLKATNNLIAKLSKKAKASPLSSIEQNRLDNLKATRDSLSTRLGEKKANFKSAEDIAADARAEAREADDLDRSLEARLAAARAKAADKRLKEGVERFAGVENPDIKPLFTPTFNAKQDNVFSALRKRLNNLGMKDVNLERAQIVEGSEGTYNPLTKTIALSMGLYDPKLNDQQLFDQLSEVMNHELIHSLVDLNLITKKELATLKKAASKLNYVRATKDGSVKRKYTYQERADRIYPELDAEGRQEEAIAEMFRDYVAGRLKIGGAPRSIFEKIKRAIKAIIGAHVDEGFTDVDQIFSGIRSGEVGRRERVEEPSTNLSNFIRNNPDGFTINPDTLEPVEGGYVVAPLKQAEIIVGESLPEADLISYIEDNKAIAKAIGRPVYLGGWFDSESQQYFLDNTIIVQDANEALYIAEAADQLAIFNLNNFEEIRTNEAIEQLKQSGSYESNAAVRYKRNLEKAGRRFEKARDKRRAVEERKSSKGIKKSKLTFMLTDEQRGNSVLDFLDPNTGVPKFKSKPGDRTKVAFAEDLLKRREGRAYDVLNSTEDREEVSRIMAAEAEAALISSPDAIGWYDAALKLAKQVLQPLYPEITPNNPDGTPNSRYEPESESVFDFITAITSNGLAVVDNYDFTARLYDHWKSTGRILEDGTGDQGKSMIQGLSFWNKLADQGLDPLEIQELLLQKMPRGEVNRFLADALGERRVGDLEFKSGSSEEANTEVSVAIVLGPKIGNGFYRNLKGDFNPLTMDRWWMRFFNRITGDPFVQVSDTVLDNNESRVWNAISSNELSEMEREIIAIASDKIGVGETIDRSDIPLLAPELEKAWNRDFFNKAYNNKIEELTTGGEYDFQFNNNGTPVGKDANVVKKIAQEARPAKPELSKAVTTYLKNTKTELQEDPRSGPDRTAMREVTDRARELLRQNNQIAVDLTNADFQALMWYAEKRIFEAGGVRKGRGEDNDYADGAIALLRKRGISDDKIKNTLPSSERRRVDPEQGDGSGDGEPSSIPREKISPKQGDFLAGRELVLDDPDDQGVTDQERDEALEILSPLEIAGDYPPVKHSKLTASNPFTLERTPLKGEPNPIYGYMMDRGKPLPIVLTSGSHDTFESGVEVGFGLRHIHERKHDEELFKNSNYKRVEKAIFDLLSQWKKQGFDDGESVISYPSQGNMVLEWRNNIMSSAPPMRLVLTRGEDLPKNIGKPPVKDAFYIKTFFPILEQKNRSTQPKRGRAVFNQSRPAIRAMRSKLMSSTMLNAQTPDFGPSDLERSMRDRRYAGTQRMFANIFKKVGSKFGVDNQAIDDGTEAFFTKMQDSMSSLGRMYDTLRMDKRIDIPRDYDAYFQELLMHGKVGARKTAFRKEELTPVLETVAKINVSNIEADNLKRMSGYFRQIVDKTKNSNHALANAYLYAEHAIERNKRLSEISNGQITSGSGMTDSEAQSIISFVNRLDAPRRNALMSVSTGVQSIISGTNGAYIDGGLIPDYKDDPDVDDDTKQAFERYNNYVPLRGFADADTEARLDLAPNPTDMTQRIFGSKGSPNKTALGRNSYAGDILSNVAVQRQAAIDKAEKNKVGITFLNLLETYPDDTVEYAEILQNHPLKRVMRNGRISHMPDRDFTLSENDPVMPVRRDGKEFLIGFNDPRVASAMMGAGSSKQVGVILRGLHMFTRTYANLVTSWNPAFLLGNFPRDVETALVNAQQYGFTGTTTDVLKNLPKSIGAVYREIRNQDPSKGDPYWRNRYKQFYDNGGKNSLNQMNDLLDNQRDIRNIVSDIVDAENRGDKTAVRKLMEGTGKGAKSLVGYVETLNDTLENATRLAFFDVVMTNLEGQGVPEDRAAREAAAAARQLTTNFAKGGDSKTLFNSLYLFYNASLQGSMAIMNAAINSPRVRKILGGIVLAGFTLDIINGLVSGDEDDDGIVDYDNINDYKLEHSLVFPDLNKDGTFVTLPAAYGLNIFYNFGRVLGNQFRRGVFGQEGTMTPTQAAVSTVATAANTINPFGGNNFLTFLSPTITDLPIELMTNKNFMDSPIYKELSPYEKYTSRTGQYWSTTGGLSKGIANTINETIGGGTEVIPGTVLGTRVDINPDVIEHIIDFMLGGAGRFLVQSGEVATKLARDPSADVLIGEDNVRRTPIVNKFLTAVTEKDRSGDYYDKRDKVLAVRKQVRDAAKSGDRELIIATRDRNIEAFRVMESINKIDRQIFKLKKQRKLITRNPNISDQARTDAEERIDDAIFRLIKVGQGLMKDV